MMRVRLSLTCGMLISLAACSAQPFGFFSQKQDAPVMEIAQENRWWSVFHDPLMDGLVDELMAQNLDIKIAQARIREARGVARTARSGFFPDISAASQASRGNNQAGSDKPLSIGKGGFDAQWEIDVFGQTRALVDASEQRVESRTASQADVINTTVAELMRAVVQWRQAEETVAQTQALLATQDEQIELFSERAKAGLIDATFLARAQAERDQTATQLPLAQASLDAAQYQIERLLGKDSGALTPRLASAKGELFVPPAAASLDVSVEQIRRRPDIRAASAELMAANADLAQAEANLWPRISIGAFFGAQDGSDALRLADNPVWSLTSGIAVPLLNFGRLRGAVDVADSRAQAASLAYENISLTALQETKTALSDYLQGINAVSQQEKALERRRETVTLASERSKRGLTDMTDLTTAQAELNQATLLLIERKATAAIAYVRLQKALGTSVVTTPLAIEGVAVRDSFM